MRLRPLTEDDWAPLLAWNNDPEVLEFAEGDDSAVTHAGRGAAHLALDFRQRALLSHGTRRRGSDRETATDGCRAIRFLTDDLGTLDLREPT